MIRRILFVMVALVACMVAGAQSADKLYKDGKALYDAKNYTAAVPKLKAAAEKGHKKAQYAVGKCYKDGRGVEKDRKKAVAWFSKAAKQDNADGQYALGKSYLKGKGVEADEKKAKSWLSKAVNNPKDGADILVKIRKDAAAGDEDAKRILKLIGK